jgi:hypothetical protein
MTQSLVLEDANSQATRSLTQAVVLATGEGEYQREDEWDHWDNTKSNPWGRR